MMRTVRSIKISLITFFTAILFAISCSVAYANPYFYLTGDIAHTTGEIENLSVRLNSDSSNIGVIQTVVHYDSSLYNTYAVSTANSQCSLWAPANSAPPGRDITAVTPYFYNSTVVIACGFIGSGYNSTDGLIATIRLTPSNPGNGSFSFSDSYMAFLGSSITPGAMGTFNTTISGTPTPTQSPTPDPSATPTATPTPTASPTPSSTSSVTAAPTASSEAGITPSPIVNTTTLFDDVEIVDVTDNLNPSTGNSGSTSVAGSSELEVVDQADSVPPAPTLEERPSATPFKIPENLYQAFDQSDTTSQDGEVLSVQGLRDLLVPGKSKADKTVVMINFISLVLFLLLLAIMLWKMSMNSRAAKLKSQHIHEIVEGELAALESKMQVMKEKEGQDVFKNEFEDTVSHILTGFTPEKSKKKEK